MALLDNISRYYNLDETSGTTVYDSTDNYDATNTTFDINYTGKIGKCYSGDGSDIRNFNISKTMPTDGSISFWVYVKSFSGISQGQWRLCMNAGTNGWNILRVGFEKGSSQGLPLFSIYDNGDYTIKGGETMAPNTWYHFVVTWGASGMKFYVNNSSVGTNAYTGNGDGNQPMYVGTIQQQQSMYFPDAYIDEVGVWDRQLSTGEIESLYNGGAGLTYPFTGGGGSGSGSDTSSISESISVGILGTTTGITDRDCFWVNNNGTWVQFQDFEGFDVKKTMNGVSEFSVTLYDIQDTQKVYFKEQAQVIFFVGTNKILKGRIQTIEYASEYECTAKGNGMEVKLLDRDLIKSGDKRVEYDNISAQTIAKEIISVNTDGTSPWIINPGTDGLFTSDYGNTTLRFEYANRLNAIGALCNAISYEWEVYQNADYSADYLRIKNLLGNQTSVKTYNISGTNANCSKTERNVDITNLVNYISCLGYGDGINQIETSTYSASTIYSVLSSDITATSTSIVLANASSFASSGTIRIMEEIITYTGKSSNTLTGCTRGTSGTTAKSHKINCYVEKYYTQASPQAGSSIATYGIMDYTLINRDIMDIDTLEVIASGYLLDRMTPIISITIEPNEPMTDIGAVTMGDMITINDAESGMNNLQVRVVGLEYKDDYGVLTMDISASNRSLEFIEQMNKAREDQQNMQKYMQGATNIYALMETTEGDSTHYIDNRFYMPSEVTALNKVLVNFKIKAVKTLRVVKDFQNVAIPQYDIPTTWHDIPGSSINLNVISGDKVLVIFSIDAGNDGGEYVNLQLRKDSGDLGDTLLMAEVGDSYWESIMGAPYMDTITNTGSVTYKIRGRASGGYGYMDQGYMTCVVFSSGFEEGTLTNPSVGVYVGEDGGTMSLIGTYATDQSDLDITSACQAIGINKWIDIQFRPLQEMRIEMNAYVKMFLESTE